MLFLLVVATLFLRPGEIIRALAGLPIYEVLIVSACLLSAWRIRRQFTWTMLRRQPISLCVVGLLAAVVLSHLTHFSLYGVRVSGTSFLKLLVFYALLVSVVNAPRRFRSFLLTTAVCASAMISLCVVDFVGWHDFEFIKQLDARADVGAEIEATGAPGRILRMRGTGIFQDPNDISLLIVTTAVLAVFFLSDRSRGRGRFVWLLPLVILGVALLLTRSRGGLLAAGAAGMTIVVARYGKRAALVAGGMGLGALPFIAGRQSSIDVGSGTGHERILLWREGFEALKSPEILFGIGQNMYADLAGLVAHNSFVHAYVELGLFGGTLFFGCFFFAALGLYRMSRPGAPILHPELARFRPYMAAILAGLGTGMLSLSRCYVVPTYLVFGMAASYLNLVTTYRRPPRLLVCWDRWHFTRLAAGSAALFASCVLFVKVFA